MCQCSQKIDWPKKSESKLNRNITVVHITPHLGGGVGTSLSNFINQSETLEVSNQVFCLDWCEDLKEDLKAAFSEI